MSKATIYTSGVFIGYDNLGKPLSYGTVEFTDNETGAVIHTYANAERTEVNDNPVKLSSVGKANIFLDDGSYNVVLRDRYENIIEALTNFSPSGGGGVGGGGYQGEYFPEIGAEYPEDNPSSYGSFWTIGNTGGWTFQTGDLAGQVGQRNDIVMWSVNGWTLLELGFDLTAFLNIDGTNSMNADLNVGLHKVVNVVDATDPRDAVNLQQLEAEMDDVWDKDEFIDASGGLLDAGKPVKTNPQGLIDASFLELELFTYQGEHDPRGQEYPSEAGLQAGDFFSIDLPEGTDYTFLTGNLTGTTVQEGDALVFVSTGRWAVINVNLEATDYVKVDGSHAMEANLSLGGHRIGNLADAEADNEAVTLGQVQALMQVPVGVIVMWSGVITEIPSTWALCNGLNNTPDMTDRFVLGTVQQAQIGDIGGDNTATMPAHSHSTENHVHTTPNHSHTMAHTHTGTTNDGGAHTHTYSRLSGTAGGNDQYNSGIYVQGNYSTSSSGTHSHSFTTGGSSAGSTGSGNGGNTGSGGAGATGSAGGTGSNMPAYLKLAFIMKV